MNTENKPKLTIGQLAALTHTSPHTLRYYEKMELLSPAMHSEAGYRLYERSAEHIVRFIKGAKMLGFTLTEINALLSLKASDTATCGDVLTHTTQKIKEAQRKINELKAVKQVLEALNDECPGGDVSSDACPILDYIISGGN